MLRGNARILSHLLMPVRRWLMKLKRRLVSVLRWWIFFFIFKACLLLQLRYQMLILFMRFMYIVDSTMIIFMKNITLYCFWIIILYLQFPHFTSSEWFQRSQVLSAILSISSTEAESYTSLAVIKNVSDEEQAWTVHFSLVFLVNIKSLAWNLLRLAQQHTSRIFWSEWL